MFDLDWSKLMLIAVIAVVFIGPKELPSALRTLGKWVAKARQMAGEFQRNVDDMMREAELQDIKKSVDEIRGIASNPTSIIEKTIDPKGEISSALTPPDFGSLDSSAAKPTDGPTSVAAPASPPSQPAPSAAPVTAAPAPSAAGSSVAAAPAAPAAQPAPPVVEPPPAGTGTRASA